MELKNTFFMIHNLRVHTKALYERARRENTPAAWDLFRNAERQFSGMCDYARTFIDCIPDNTISLGLRLHYVNGLNWHQTALHTGDPKIRRKCQEFLRKEENRNVKSVLQPELQSI